MYLYPGRSLCMNVLVFVNVPVCLYQYVNGLVFREKCIGESALISVYACACICEGDYKSARAKTVLVPVLEYQYVNVLVSGGSIIM